MNKILNYLNDEQGGYFKDIVSNVVQNHEDGAFDANYLLITGKAGCSTKGNIINISLDNNKCKVHDVKKILNITSSQLKQMAKIGVIKKNKGSHFYDINSINLSLFKLIKSDITAKKYGKVLSNDKKFTSKYLKLEYWLGFNSVKFSLEQVKQLRKYERYFEIDQIRKLTNFNPKNKIKMIMLIQKNILAGNIYYTKYSNISYNYWKIRGWDDKYIYSTLKELQHGRQCTTKDFYKNNNMSDMEIKNTISNIQKNNSIKCQLSRITNPEKFIGVQPNQKEYWIKKGFNESEAIEKVQERQRTFSLEICVEKYGIKKGTDIFNKRQLKWQKTLNSKPQEEIDRINKLKSSSRPNLFDKSGNKKQGMLYYIRFYNENTEFWKIGITSKTINERYGSKLLMLNKHKLNREVIFELSSTLEDCYILEQNILIIE